MRHVIALATFFLVSCIPAKTVLDLAQVACIIANAESEERVVKDVCRLTNDVMPYARFLIAEQRAATRKAGVCK